MSDEITAYQEVLKKIVSAPEMVALEFPDGTEWVLKMYPLSLEELYKADAIAPIDDMTDEERDKIIAGDKDVYTKIILRRTPEQRLQSAKQDLYVLGVLLKKNYPDFDVSIIEGDAKLFGALRPLAQDVYSKSQPDPELLKKK